MSDNNISNPESTRSAAEIRQDITDYILSHPDELSDVPSVKQFVEEHGRLTNEIAAAKKRGKRLAKAKEKYEPLEQRVVAGRQELKDAEVELAKSHRPLGEASFQAFLTGELEDHPVFADRLAAHKRVQELRQERDGLAPSADAGMVQKTKAKAQQLAITAKIKIEETKVGKLDTEIGRKAVEGNLDESVRCDSTNEHLGRIAEQRGTVAECALKLREADTSTRKAAKQLCEAVPLQHIESSKTFDAEMKTCKATVRGSQISLSAEADSLVSALSTCDLTKLPKVMAVKVDAFATAKGNAKSLNLRDKSKVAQRVASSLGGSAIRWWGGLNTKGKAITVVVCGVFFVALGAVVTPDRDVKTKSETPEGPLIGVDSKTAETDTESMLSAAMKKYPNGYFEKGPNEEEIKVGGDGLDSDWYFHYYLDDDGNKVSHGRGHSGPVRVSRYGEELDGLMSFLKDNGKEVVSAYSYLDGTLASVSTLVEGDEYRKDEYIYLSVGVTLHFRSLWKVTKNPITTGGTISYSEILKKPQRVRDMPPLSITKGWPTEEDFVHLDMDDIFELLGNPNSSYDHVDPESSQSAFVWKQPDDTFTVVIGVRHISGLHRSVVRVNTPRNVASMIVEDLTGNALGE